MAGPIAFYCPDPIQSCQLIPGGNTPASGAQLFVFQPGTTAHQNSYTDASASTARSNPIILDSGGNIPGNGEIWITSTAKFVLAPPNDSDPPQSPYWTRDNVPGINQITAAQVQALSAQTEWVPGTTPVFVGVTAFTVTGDQTTTWTTGRRVKATVTGGDRFGVVTSQTLSGASTTIGVTLDSSTLNAGLSQVSYGLLSTPNGSVPWTQITSTGLFFESPVTTGAMLINGTSTINGDLTLNGHFFGPGLVFIASTAANNTSSIAFNSSVISSLYDEFEFHLHNFVPSVNLSSSFVRVSSTNGVTWTTTAIYDYFGGGAFRTGTASTFAQGALTQIQILLSHSSGINNNAPFGAMNGILRLYEPYSTSGIWKRMSYSMDGSMGAGFDFKLDGMANVEATGTVNAIQFFWSTGSTAAGNIFVYGLRR